MNEREQLIKAREQLSISIKNVSRNLKLYGIASINHKKAIICNLKNNILNAYEKLKYESKIASEERERQEAIKRAERLEQENQRQRTAERKNAMMEALAERDKEIFAERKLKFKQSTTQKVSSFTGKLGSISNHLLSKISLANVDVKLRNAFEKAQIFGLEKLNSGMQTANEAKEKVSKYTSEQIQKFINWRTQLEIKRAEREYQAQIEKEERERQETIKRAERLERENQKQRTAERKSAMMEALAERDKEIFAERKLNLKQTTVQKANSINGKIGSISNNLLSKFNLANADVKIRNAFEKVQIFGLEKLNSGMQTANEAKEKVSKYTSEQIQKFINWRTYLEIKRAEREYQAQIEKEERERQEAIKRAERLEQENQRQRIAERKSAMINLLNEEERNEYNEQYTVLNTRKQEILQTLKEEKNKLLNISSDEFHETRNIQKR